MSSVLLKKNKTKKKPPRVFYEKTLVTVYPIHILIFFINLLNVYNKNTFNLSSF